jgi:hypothetical protein
MKKLILAVIMCFAFSVHATASSIDAKLKHVEALENKINAFKTERANIENKLSSIRDEMRAAMEKEKTLREKIINLEHNKTFDGFYYKALIEKKENDIEFLTSHAAKWKLSADFNKINLNINKAKIELIKVKIKVGKTPEIPLEAERAMVKHIKSGLKLNKAKIELIKVKIKEKEAYVKYLKSCLEISEKIDEISKNVSDSGSVFYTINTNLTFAKLGDKQAVLRLKLKQAQSKKAQTEIKEAKAKVKFSKTEHKLYKTHLKFKINENDLKNFLYHD